MGLRGEVNDGANGVTSEQFADQFAVGNVAVHKSVRGVRGKRVEIVWVVIEIDSLMRTYHANYLLIESEIETVIEEELRVWLVAWTTWIVVDCGRAAVGKALESVGLDGDRYQSRIAQELL